MATKRLFWEDSYLDNCEAMVMKAKDNEIVLDQTVFYAFSGGQASDSGTINNIPVKEARKSGEDFLYVFETPPALNEGDKVTVKIDLEKRLKLMKLHSASHLVYFLVENKTGLKKIIGSNVTVDKGRLDYEYPEAISPILPEVESMANE
jgi:Ser-tRNA(Ala) deacylase AlaX